MNRTYVRYRTDQLLSDPDEEEERGSQDSNLGPPVLETGATTKLSYCPISPIVA